MTILDANGNAIPERQIREAQTINIGAIAREFDQHPARGLTPQRLHAILLGGERGDITGQIDLADDIEERDGHVFAELQKRSGAVAQLEWDIVEPDNPTPAEKSLTAQVREWIGELGDLEELTRAMMGGVMRGFACHEMVWKPTADGSGQQVLLPEITFRPQRWFTVDRETRNQLLLRREDGLAGEPLQQFSWIAHIHHSRNGYLARLGLARILAWPYLYKNFAQRDMAEFLEIYGLPMRLGKYPSGSSEEEKRRLLQAVAQIGHNAAGIIPAGMVIDFQAAAQGSEGPYDSMQDRMEAIQSKVILGQTLTASEGKHGTQALGQVHNEVRMDIRNDDVRQVQGTFNRQLIYPLCTLNSGSAEPRRLPRIVFDTAEAEDLTAYASSLPQLIGAGFKISRKWAQEKLRIPEPAEGEDLLQITAPAAPAAPGGDDPFADPAKPPTPQQLRADPKAPVVDPKKDALDDLVGEIAGDWQPMLRPMVEPLLAELDRAIEAGESLTAFRDRLPQLVTQMDYTPMGERIARASFSAGLAGAADLDLNAGARP